MKTEHEKEQEEAHRRDFEKDWADLFAPLFAEMGYTPARALELKETVFQGRLDDDKLARMLDQYYPPEFS